MTLAIPSPLVIEHKALHAELADILAVGGPIGDAARNVADALHAHFLREEEYAMPPLALLTRLARGETTPDMREAIPLVERLKKDLPQMLQEHQVIVRALDRLVDTAQREGRADLVAFAEKLKLHAQMEEAVLYPAAILVGELLKTKLEASASHGGS